MRDMSDNAWWSILGKENSWCRSVKTTAVEEIIEHTATEVQDTTVAITTHIVVRTRNIVERVHHE